MSEVIYMNCPKCGAKMAKSPGICASIPPKYDEFRCPQNLVLHDTFGYEEGRQTGQNEGVKFVLNNPEKYGLQKPAEWSEEDENMRNLIIETLDDNSHYFPFKETKKKMMDWLKSLRPRWKPSEDHLSALLAVFNDPNNIGSQTCQLALTDLYEQLKKL